MADDDAIVDGAGIGFGCAFIVAGIWMAIGMVAWESVQVMSIRESPPDPMQLALFQAMSVRPRPAANTPPPPPQASITPAPNSSRMPATADLPDATPPDKPMMGFRPVTFGTPDHRPHALHHIRRGHSIHPRDMIFVAAEQRTA